MLNGRQLNQSSCNCLLSVLLPEHYSTYPGYRTNFVIYLLKFVRLLHIYRGPSSWPDKSLDHIYTRVSKVSHHLEGEEMVHELLKAIVICK